MFPIQIILGFALIILLGLYVRFFRRKPVRQALFVLVLMTGVVFVIFPELTTKLAKLVRVGRGTDLLLYVVIVLAGFGSLHMYSQQKRQAQHIATLVREQALMRAEFTNDTKHHE
ncbi:MAG: DUF2304 domain-containing protein [Bacteroidia bacterium]